MAFYKSLLCIRFFFGGFQPGINEIITFFLSNERVCTINCYAVHFSLVCITKSKHLNPKASGFLRPLFSSRCLTLRYEFDLIIYVLVLLELDDCENFLGKNDFPTFQSGNIIIRRKNTNEMSIRL